MKMQFTILGAKTFNDTVEGTKYDTTKLFVMLPEKEIDSDSRKVVGFNAVDMVFGTSVEYIKHDLGRLSYPCLAELDIDMTTKGMTCSGFKHIKPVSVAA